MEYTRLKLRIKTWEELVEQQGTRVTKGGKTILDKMNPTFTEEEYKKIDRNGDGYVLSYSVWKDAELGNLYVTKYGLPLTDECIIEVVE